MNTLFVINIIFWTTILIAIIYIFYQKYKHAYMKEGFGIGDFADIFGVIPNIFNKVFSIFTGIGAFFVYIGKIVTCYIPGLFKWLYQHLVCTISKLQSFFDCFVYYAFEIFCKVLYFPILLFFFFSGLTDLENSIWDNIEQIDIQIHNLTGYHICHYSDSIQDKCYKCKIGPLVRAPRFPSF